MAGDLCVSEGVRGTMLDDVPHIAPGICAVVLLGFLALFTTTGIRGFRRRAID